MNYWDSIREIQRLLENLRPIEDQIRAVQLVEDTLRNASVAMMPATDLLRQIERTQQMLRIPQELVATHDAIAAAVRSLPDLRGLALSAFELSNVSHLTERLNASIRDALFLGELEISEEEREADLSEDYIARQADAQLVDVVPAEALECLRRVEFAPMVLLDRALRDPELMRRLSAREFEGFVAALIQQLGFEDVVLTPGSGDEGRDVLATKRVHGIAILCAFECKRYAPDRPVGPEIARALLGTILHGKTRAAKGILVTTSFFAPATRRFILTEPSLDGKDFDGIVEWLKEYSSKRRRDAT